MASQPNDARPRGGISMLTVIALTLGAFVVLLGGVFVVSQNVLRQQGDDGLIVNLASRQQMLLQDMTKETLMFLRATRSDGRDSPRARAHHARVERSLAVFDTTLAALRDGGQAPLDLEMTAYRQIPKSGNAEVFYQLQIVTNRFHAFREQLREVRETPSVDDAAVAALVGASDETVAEVTTAVALLQGDAEAKVGSMVAIQASALAAGIVLFILGMALSRSLIAAPVRRLAIAADYMADGDLDADVVGGGLRELSILGGSLRSMRDNLRGTINELRQSDKVKELAEENAQLAARAEEASRAKSEFLATMSHELRTPMNAVIGYADLAGRRAQKILRLHEDDRRTVKLVADQGRFIDQVKTAAEGLLSLINQILDISKIEAGKMELYLEELSVADHLRKVAETARPLVDNKHNALVIDCPDDLGIIETDGEKLKQAVFNLLSNAAKFTQNGTVTLKAAREGETISISVSDTGIGMTEDEIGRIFEPFRQADGSTTRRFGGTGLGLSICRSIAGLMSGEIKVESTPNVGSTFSLVIPVEQASRQDVVDLSANHPDFGGDHAEQHLAS